MKKIFLTVAILFGLFFPTSSFAAECSLYEQSHPAFLLDGAHLSTGKCTTCASCHRAGVFTGTPKSCVACHNGDPTRVTVGRSPGHIPTLLVECNQCHTTTLFTVGTSMNHTSVTAFRCDSCHNGNYRTYSADRKPTDHIPTTGDCGTCHTTRNWDVSHSSLHAGVTTGCVTCHDGSVATGKSSYAAHPATSDACESCHSTDANFKCAMEIKLWLKNFAHVVFSMHRPSA